MISYEGRNNRIRQTAMSHWSFFQHQYCLFKSLLLQFEVSKSLLASTLDYKLSMHIHTLRMYMGTKNEVLSLPSPYLLSGNDVSVKKGEYQPTEVPI